MPFGHQPRMCRFYNSAPVGVGNVSWTRVIGTYSDTIQRAVQYMCKLQYANHQLTSESAEAGRQFRHQHAFSGPQPDMELAN